MARPSQLLLIALVYGAGVLVGVWRGGTPGLVGIVAGAALLLPGSIAIHWANEAADVATDALAVRTRFSGGSGALHGSPIEVPSLLRWSLLLAAGVGVLAAALVITNQLAAVAGLLLLVGLAGGLAYSVPPVALMRRGLGEPLNAILGGLLLPLFGVAVVRGRLETLDVLSFLPFASVTFCSVMATAWPDRDADGRTGKLTLQVRLAPARLRLIHGVSSAAWAIAVTIAIWLDAVPFGPTLFLGLPLVWLGRARYTRRSSPWPSVAAMVAHILVTALAAMLALS